ncbi:MAG: hypothetical protein U9P72_04585 [Campylobacterota bacterium]|nr:hypothetical protein [Campylobacterota bacterium]
MKTREFILTNDNFDIEYGTNPSTDLIEEYLIEDLEVPQDCIESLNIYDNYVNIKLDSTKRYFNDDWYVNLRRVS